MKYAVVDIGSNTIKAFVYAWDKNKLKNIDSCHFHAMLYSHIKNNIITKTGIDILKDCVSQSMVFLSSFHCDKIFIFATSAVRDSQNHEEIAKAVLASSGIKMDILSKEEETECDILSLQNEIGKCSACGADLGGGSAQVFTLDENGVVYSQSLPIGALRIKEEYVSNEYPTAQEISDIKAYVRGCLIDFSLFEYNEIHLMGGSAYNILKLSDNEKKAKRIKVCELDYMLLNILQNPHKDAFLKKKVNKRAGTIMPAMAILSTINEVLKVNDMVIHKNGVREGYLLKKII